EAFISDVAGNMKADSDFQKIIQGEQGEQGPQGESGADGEDGPTASEVASELALNDEFKSGVADDLANNSDFQIKVKGEKGDTGVQGIQGIQGQKGDTGAPGATGRDGASGEVRIVHSFTALPQMNRVCLSRNIMRAKRTFMFKMLQAIDRRSCDIKGNNDPFVLVFGGYERCDVDDSDLGNSSHFYGAFLGEDWSRHVSNSLYLRYGFGIGQVRSQSNFFGPMAEDFYGATCKETAGSAFVSGEFYNEKRQKMNLCAMGAINLGNNKVRRYDGKPEKFDDASFHGKVAFMREVFRLKGVRISPKVDLRYTFFHANIYALPPTEADQQQFETYLTEMFDTETLANFSAPELSGLYTAYARARVVPSVDNHIVDMILGLSFEKEMDGNKYEIRPFKLQCDFGWQRQVMRKMTSIFTDYGGIRNTFSMDMGNGPNDFFTCSGSFRKRLHSHWEIRGQWSGTCGIKYRCHSANLSLGYEF
ncbi:MAG: collagen-like protein, partial [Puniceicoccales bacterium]|nr:collagen-like protein [Puniceicoccales bacterium]